MRASTSTTGGASAHPDYMSSAEALAVLSVKPQTLYSYVSRGMIRRITIDGKTCLYNNEDIRRLRARSIARSGHGAVAGGALQWGEPVLVTGITEITSNGPRYRAHFASELARSGYNFESVAEYLWTGDEIDPSTRWRFDPSIARIAPQLAALAGAYPEIHPRQLLTEIVLLRGVEHNHDQETVDRPPSMASARALVQALCTAFGFFGAQKRFIPPQENESVAGYILRAFGIDASPAKLQALNATMILLADHEFSPATFAARIAASSLVDLHSCVGAALQVLFGSALGLRCDRIEQALQSTTSLSDPDLNVDRADGAPIGFGHPLYVENGDPRAKEILEIAFSLTDHASASQEALETLRSIDNHQGVVSLDAALVVLCRALGLTGRVAGGLLAISRSAGWIAHINEQYDQDFMIRPRGKFSPAVARPEKDNA